MPKPHDRREPDQSPQVDRLRVLHDRLDRTLRERQQLRAEIDRWTPAAVCSVEQQAE
jgi:hypothetical protein